LNILILIFLVPPLASQPACTHFALEGIYISLNNDSLHIHQLVML